MDLTFDFGMALQALRGGHTVRRLGWHGTGMSVSLQTPNRDSLMTLPYLFLTTPEGDRVPWLASQTDILAEDWTIAEVA